MQLGRHLSEDAFEEDGEHLLALLLGDGALEDGGLRLLVAPQRHLVRLEHVLQTPHEAPPRRLRRELQKLQQRITSYFEMTSLSLRARHWAIRFRKNWKRNLVHDRIPPAVRM